jgi:hypothetical protein
LNAFQFGQAWLRTSEYNLENLLVEVVVRGELDLLDKGVAYTQIGDFGIWRLLYLAKLEADLESKRAI